MLTRVYISGREDDLKRRNDAFLARFGTAEVLCFKKDLPGGTVLQRSDLGAIDVPEVGLRGQALKRENLAEIIGRRTLIAHQRGDVLFWSDIEGGNLHDKGLSADIKRSMRAMSIAISNPGSVSGMVRANDHVDVIGTFVLNPADKTLVTRTILQNVLVLATGRDTAKSRAIGYRANENYSTVTLEVNPREAEMLAFVEQMRGRLTLTLRNSLDASYERELPQVDYARIQNEIEELNTKRQQKLGGR